MPKDVANSVPEVFEGQDFKIIVHDRCWNFDYDSYYIMEPSESNSGGWEVWEAEWLDAEMKKADLKHVLLEAHGKAFAKIKDLHLALSFLPIGFGCGYKDGLKTMKQANKFAFQSLSGEIDCADLIEAAGQWHHPKDKSK
ncbi:hypothetical protein BFP76_12365 [Amylibacter kogurei]|uniref:Uncharacterized protein n=1 Tax=Paramylibacter kogurei TaxID=1889778 RepID=A0A2G5KCC9_9RHOB|nr:hypothetical protein [Amylibacter kogurei]PIB26673.1 hypothetical protein BFP76_12365 [Amylibacter kogurei]